MSAAKRKYKPYPKYKDSGVEWLGRVPEHWKVKRLRHVAPFSNSNVDKKSYEGQKPVRLCNYTDVYYNEFIRDGMEFMEATASDAEIERFQLRKGQIIITKDSEDPTDIGIPSLVTEDMEEVICGYHLTVIFPEDYDTGRYLHRSIQSMHTRAHFYVESPGITRYGLNQDTIADTPVALPNPKERKAIADFIERECGRMDKLVEKKQEFISLLKEKRQALITHAVTKGLDPKAEMKDSGVEWLGEVPKHWDVKPLWSLVSCNDSVLPDNTPNEQLIRYVDISSVSYDAGISRTEEMEFGSAPSRARRLAKVGDIVISTVRTYLRAIAVVTEEYSNCFFSTGFAVLHPLQSVHQPILNWMVLSDGFIGAVVSHSEGISYPAINASQLTKFKVAIPPDNEIQAISTFLSQHTTRIDRLIAKTIESIDLLKERKTALITAAVTGQIDVLQSA